MSDTDEVVFEDPPPENLGRPDLWTARFQVLRDNPGRWINATATWGVKTTSHILALKSRGRDFTDVTVSQRKNTDGTTTVYVGYKVSRDGRGTNTGRTGA